MRNCLWFMLLGVLIASGAGCGKGEYDRRMRDSIESSGALSEEEETAASPPEAFAMLLEKGCMFFNPSTGIRDLSLDAVKAAPKLTEYDENAKYDVLLDGSAMSDADTASLPPLASQITGATVTGALGDGTMANIIQLRGLTWVNLLNSSVTDDGLGKLGDLANVRSFRMMDNASISDDAIVPVLAMENLKQVYVKGPFTDVGLEELAFNQYIESIEITLGGDVTQEVIDYLKQEMVDTTITAK